MNSAIDVSAKDVKNFSLDEVKKEIENLGFPLKKVSVSEVPIPKDVEIADESEAEYKRLLSEIHNLLIFLIEQYEIATGDESSYEVFVNALKTSILRLLQSMKFLVNIKFVNQQAVFFARVTVFKTVETIYEDLLNASVSFESDHFSKKTEMIFESIKLDPLKVSKSAKDYARWFIKNVTAITTTIDTMTSNDYFESCWNNQKFKQLRGEYEVFKEKALEIIKKSKGYIRLHGVIETDFYTAIIDEDKKKIRIIVRKPMEDLIPLDLEKIEAELEKINAYEPYDIEVEIPDELLDSFPLLDVNEVQPQHAYRPIRVRGVVANIFPKTYRLWRTRVFDKEEGYKTRFILFPEVLYDETGKKVKPIPAVDNVRVETQEGEIQLLPEITEKSRVPTKSIKFVAENELVDKLLAGERYEFIAIPFYMNPLNMNEEMYLYITKATRIDQIEVLRITEGDIERFKEFLKSIEKKYDKQIEEIYKAYGIKLTPALYSLVISFAPEVRPDFYNIILKLAILIAGVKGYLKNGRKEIHVLIIGEPSTGKTHTARELTKIHPKAMYASGKSATGRGLTVAVNYDKKTQRWYAMAGVIVLADGGIAIIDELDKSKPEDISNLYEALEDGKVTVARAGIFSSFPARTGVIGIANPPGHVITSLKDVTSIFKKINLEPAFVSRFDIIAIIKDETTYEQDIEDAEYIIKHARGEKFETPMDYDFLKKYIVYASSLKPQINDDVARYIAKKYAELREEARKSGDTAYSIKKRNLEGILRIVTAIAKLNLRENVTKDDVDLAISLMTITQKIRELGEKVDSVNKRTLKEQLKEQILTRGMSEITDEQIEYLSDAIVKTYNYDEGLRDEIKSKILEILSKDFVKEGLIKVFTKGNTVKWVVANKRLYEFAEKKAPEKWLEKNDDERNKEIENKIMSIVETSGRITEEDFNSIKANIKEEYGEVSDFEIEERIDKTISNLEDKGVLVPKVEDGRFVWVRVPRVEPSENEPPLEDVPEEEENDR